MARRYRSRRYRPRTGRRLRMRRSTLKRIKKDIMKCNFPTKVKFMGLTEKKVMFLTKSFDFTFAAQADAQNHTAGPEGLSFYLDPLIAENIDSILKTKTIQLQPPAAQGQAPVTGNYIVSNWDKLCILGIYIKFQPKKNMWAASDAANNINTVKCTYTMNNFPSLDEGLVKYDKECLSSKQVFTFNSNEAFTMYVPAPTTMCSTSPCVYKSKTWWALADLAKNIGGGSDFITGDESEGESESEGEDGGNGLGNAMDEDVEMGNTADPYFCTPKVSDGVYKPYIHAGRVHLESAGASYNVTINFKVALKG